MKFTKVFLLGLLLSGLAQANPNDPRQPQRWFDINWKGYYYLTSDLEPAPGIRFRTGEKFEFVGLTSGGGYVPITVYELRAVKCENPELETELILLNPAGGEKTQIAAEMRKGCNMAFFVETRLMMTASYFTDSTE